MVRYRIHTLIRIMAVLLCAGLFIQNTCPHGAAGKTTVVAQCGHCTMKQGCMMAAAPAAQHDAAAWSGAASRDIFPLFLFEDPSAPPRLEPEPADTPRRKLAPRLGSAFPLEILKPPAA